MIFDVLTTVNECVVMEVPVRIILKVSGVCSTHHIQGGILWASGLLHHEGITMLIHDCWVQSTMTFNLSSSFTHLCSQSKKFSFLFHNNCSADSVGLSIPGFAWHYVNASYVINLFLYFQQSSDFIISQQHMDFCWCIKTYLISSALIIN